MLIVGQIIRYGPALYRVSYVNECRARIIPLTKKQLTKKEWDDDGAGGVNIAANSYVEIITDLERAQDEMELASLERELDDARDELERRNKPAPVVKEAPRPVAHRRVPVSPGGGWHLSNVATPSFKEGTLAEAVWLFIGLHPGLPTSGIVEGVKAEGAVAACVSRFHQAGLIEKRS